MKYEPRIHTPESFQAALNVCLLPDYRRKQQRRQQLQELLLDMHACGSRFKFRGMTLCEAWECASADHLGWFLRHVFVNNGRPQLALVLRNIDSVVYSIDTTATKPKDLEMRRRAAIRAWFTPYGELRRTWIS